MADTPRLRAGDADRDAAIALLREAHADGRLTVDEFDERQTAALKARFLDDLAPLTADLHGVEAVAITAAPRPAAVAPVATPASWSVSVMSGRTLEFVPGMTEFSGFAMMGGNEIRLDDALGPGVTVRLNLTAIMGGNNIYVPEGVRVLDEGIAIMGGNDVEAAARGDGSNGTLIIGGLQVMGGNNVRLAGGNRDGLARRQRRQARRAIRRDR